MAKKAWIFLIVAIVMHGTVSAGGTQEAGKESVTVTVTGGSKESPMLAERVAKGVLPPVEKRLPEKPVVVEVENQLGKYGGTLRIAVNSQNRVYNSILTSLLTGRFTDQSPFLFDKRGVELESNWAEKYEMSPDARTFTIWILEGVKWSDGTLLTTDDILFTLVDVAGNAELNPAGVPSWLVNVRIEKIDQYQLQFTLPNPDPMFVYQFQDLMVPLPKKYMSQFLKGVAPQSSLNEMVNASGVKTWQELFALKSGAQNMEKPILGLWVVVSQSPEKVICERNPYFWKVDPTGRQLPYIDRFEISILASTDTIVLKGMAGEFDMDFYNTKFADFPTYKSNESKGGYTTYLWNNASGASHILFNLNYTADPAIAELLATPDFRKALSVAINRKEINKFIYLDQGVTTAISPAPGSPDFDPSFPAMYSTYDPATARSMLEALGLLDRNKDGLRELKNGGKLEIVLQIDNGMQDHIATAELIKGYWDAVGVGTKVNIVPKERRHQLLEAGDFMISMWKIDAILYPMWLRSFMSRWYNPAEHAFPKPWLDYLASNGNLGVKPPADIANAYMLWRNAAQTTSSTTRATNSKALWEAYYENLWGVGIIQEVPLPVLINNRLKNVPKDLVNSWALRTPSNANLAQFYLD